MKVRVLFLTGANPELVSSLKSILNVERADFDAKYPGLPMPEGRLMGGIFKTIEGRYVNDRLERANAVTGCKRGAY
jgi:hypothetical protein